MTFWVNVKPPAILSEPNKQLSLRDLPSSGILRRVEWQSFTDVSGQRIGPFEDGTDTLSRKRLLEYYHSTLRNIPEEGRSHQHRGGNDLSLPSVSTYYADPCTTRATCL
jgi:hypothetical protein